MFCVALNLFASETGKFALQNLLIAIINPDSNIKRQPGWFLCSLVKVKYFIIVL